MKNFSEDVRLAKKGSTEAFSRLYAEVYKDLYHMGDKNIKNIKISIEIILKI